MRTAVARATARLSAGRPPAGAAPTRRPGRAAALVVLAAATVLAWWSVLGAGTLRAAPAVGLAAFVALRLVPVRAAAMLLVSWVPASLLLAGVPTSALRPGALGDSASALFTGLDGLTVPARGAVVGDPWPLAGALLLAGIAWVAAGALATRRGRAAGVLALALTTLPLVGALALEQTTDAAWPGAVLLAAGILWLAHGRLAALVPATAVVALVAAVGAQAVGPDERWIPFVQGAARKPAFTRLDTSQTYGPLNDRRTGAAMLEVSSPEPALWRMQVLDRFDSRGWGVDMGQQTELPEPAAETVTTTVRVRGLRNRLIAAPGRITSVEAKAGTLTDLGEARQLRSAPSTGDTYRVESSVVRATAAQLEHVQIPSGPQYDDYTSMWGRRYDRQGGGSRRPAIDLVDRFRDGYASTANPWYDAIELAARLAKGATSELDLVRRVQSYLVDGDRFEYTTDVSAAGAQPILDFLLKTHEGYCQHFAGAAAMLLRLAGVPTRVVTGFATGAKQDGDTYEVRDEDAHAWIEVYFPGFGWVPFNPTPTTADATVDPAVDLLTPADAAGAGATGGGPLLLVLPALLAGAGLVEVARRRRHRAPSSATAGVGDLLARLVPGPVGPSTTLTALGPRLRGIGPEVAALAREAERARFSGDAPAGERHPRLRVWRALRRDLGTGRATVRLLRVAGARRAPGA